MEKLRIAILGANGYVGKNLIALMSRRNVELHALVRSKTSARFSGVNYVLGDAESGEGLNELLHEKDVAYYLIHSLASDGQFKEVEKKCADNFAAAAKSANVKRVIYLSGLGDDRDELSPHLASRHAVGEILRGQLDDVVEFRASAVFGAGSASYEVISFLVERLPIMVLPRWVYNKTQPISVNDAMYYLAAASDLEKHLPPIIEIGGSDVVSYYDLMSTYARVKGLRRIMIPVPFLSLYLSSLWLHLITPLHARVGRNIVESLKNSTVVTNLSYRSLFDHNPVDVNKMISEALDDETREILSPQKEHLSRFDRAKRTFGFRFGRYFIRRDDIKIEASLDKVYATIGDIGGKNGWYYLNFLWRWRAFIDRLLGGPGFSRGKSEEPLKSGDFIDCWSVKEINPPERLLLASMMKMPGDAYLEFELIDDNGSTLLYQTAFFRPKGLGGSLYWYALYPVHILLFEGLLAAIKSRSEAKRAL